MLPGYEVIELPGGETTGPQEFPRIPSHPGSVDQTLAVSQPGGDGRACPGPISLEREESDNGRSFAQNRDPGFRPERSDEDRELRRQERVGK
jgi:hypothetical protein